MTIEQAEQISSRYRDLLTDTDKRGSRQDPSLLPAPKETILKAIKVEIAQLQFIDALSEKLLKPLINAAMFLDSFSRSSLNSGDFIRAMQSRRKEIEQFVEDLSQIRRGDPFYWQRVYQMIGISLETQATSFFEGMKLKFGFRPKAPVAEPVRPSQRVSLGRYIIE